jgi:hypothetical protein
VTYPPTDEPSQQRRAIVYGRANQASAHYRPLRKGRPMPEAAAHPGLTSKAAKTANRRRFVLFVIAVIVAVAAGTAIFGVVLANPAPTAQPQRAPGGKWPEPAVQPPPTTGGGAPVQHAPPSIRRSGSLESTTEPRSTTTTRAAPGAGGDAVKPTTPAASSTVYYQNCNKARRAGAAPLHPGDPGYRAKLDKDGNGIACDEKDKS